MIRSINFANKPDFPSDEAHVGFQTEGAPRVTRVPRNGFQNANSCTVSRTQKRKPFATVFSER